MAYYNRDAFVQYMRISQQESVLGLLRARGMAVREGVIDLQTAGIAHFPKKP
jgi:hypothetical protein